MIAFGKNGALGFRLWLVAALAGGACSTANESAEPAATIALTPGSATGSEAASGSSTPSASSNTPDGAPTQSGSSAATTGSSEATAKPTTPSTPSVSMSATASTTASTPSTSPTPSVSGSGAGGTSTDPTESSGPASSEPAAPTSSASTADPNLGPGGNGGTPVADAGPAAGDAYDGLELFLFFGQSNMSGSARVEEQDKVTNDRIEFMVQYDCPSLGQTYGEWLLATPPLHGCQWSGADTGLGPADSFAKAIAEAWPDSKLGLVPCAVPGVSIDFFEKGGGSRGEGYQMLPEDFTSAYQMMLARAQEAQKRGRIRGILFHQGESDSGQQVWITKVATVVSNLRTDLDLGEEVPFIAGELPPTACCGGHNVYVNQLPDAIPNAAVATAENTTVHDEYHWDSGSVRVMGQRYADKFLQFVPNP